MVKRFFLPAVAILLLGVSTGCRPSIDDVNKKILEGKELSAKDYDVVIDYTVKSISELNDSIDAHSDDRAAMMHAVMALAVKYPESTLIANVLTTADTSKFDEDQLAQYRKAMKELEEAQTKMANALGAVRIEGDPNEASFRTAIPAENDSVSGDETETGKLKPEN